MIKVVQDWPITRRLPKNTHVWKMFIKPEELKTAMDQAGLQQKDETGLGMDVDWRGIPSALGRAFAERRANLALVPVRSAASRSKQILYMGWAIK